LILWQLIDILVCTTPFT